MLTLSDVDDKYPTQRGGKGKGAYDDDDDDYDDADVTPDLGKEAFPPLDETVSAAQPSKPSQAPPYPAPPSYAHATTAANAPVSIKPDNTQAPAPALTQADKVQKHFNESASNVPLNASPQGTARPPPGLGMRGCVGFVDQPSHFISGGISQSAGDNTELPKRVYCIVLYIPLRPHSSGDIE